MCNIRIAIIDSDEPQLRATESRKNWTLISTALKWNLRDSTDCVILSQLLNLSELHVPHL